MRFKKIDENLNKRDTTIITKAGLQTYLGHAYMNAHTHSWTKRVNTKGLGPHWKPLCYTVYKYTLCYKDVTDTSQAFIVWTRSGSRCFNV